MRKVSLLLICIFCSMSMFAGDITEAQALQKASQILKGKQLTKVQTQSRSRGTLIMEPAYYVFNAENNGGFVVIAGNDLMPEVLGYAERGSFDIANAPDNVRWLFNYYAEVARSLRNLPADRVAARRADTRSRAASSMKELIPLINTKWNQDGIYQQHCPEVNGVKTLTGCVATAMAQVVNFFQWPLNNVRETAGYVTNTNESWKPQINLETLPARKFNWFNMTDDDIAWLMRYCGQAVTMNYNVDESTAGTGSVPGALISIFNFSKGIDIASRENFSDNEWEKMLYQEIEAGRPVIYNGSNGSVGHEFILHGYKDGKFLVNWGWGGRMDGYFELTPGDIAFSEDQNVIIGIQPASSNDIEYDEKTDYGSREVHLEKQGQLASLLPTDERYKIRSLKITGELGGKDIDVIHDMAGGKYDEDDNYLGHLAKLDLSEARIVGGERYSNDRYDCIDDFFNDWFFSNCPILTEIVLPKTLKVICSGAFDGTSIFSIVIPKSVSKIDSEAFHTSSLKSIQVEEGNETYYSQNNAIYEKSTGILIRGCKGTMIPEGVEEIGLAAFTGAGLKSLTLPKSLKKIGDRAFAYNYDLKDLYIPASVEEISGNAFMGTNEIISITVDKENPKFDSRDNCNAIIETATNTLIIASNATVTIPATVTALGTEAFYRLKIKRIEIPQSVTEIGVRAFSQSKAKTIRVYYPEPISIGEGAFDYLPEYSHLVVPDGTKQLYEAAKGWNEFTSNNRFVIEASDYLKARVYTINLSSAGTLASEFPDDKKTLTETLKVTGSINGEDIQYMKELCGQDGILTTIDLSEANIVGDGSTEANVLSAGAFQNTFSLEHIILPKSLVAIGNWAFQDSGIKDFVLPKNVKDIGRDLFYYARNLEALSVEPGNTTFDSRDNCNAIIETATNTLRIGCRNTVIPETITALGDCAFSGMPSLTEVNLPKGITSIGWAAFWADEALTKVYLSESVTNLGESPFGGCDNITSFVIDPKNPKYDSRDNCNAIIETATNTLIQGFSTTKIPDGVKTIATASFRSIMSLTEIEIPASVEKIEPEAFLYCNQMTKVVSHVKKPYALSLMVFEGDNMKDATLYVPYGTKTAYANTSGWDNFRRIKEMDYVEGEFVKNAASVETTDFGKAYAAINGSVQVPVTIVGEGVDPVTNIDYTITTGNTATEHHLELPAPISFMETSEILVPMEADASLGQQEKTFTLTKVNNAANGCTTENLKAVGKLVTVAKKPKVMAVVEEATGTWCGWCSRGIPALTLLNKTYRDDVVTIAVHGGGNDDPMILDNYQLNVSSYPSCMVNRCDIVDPYYGSGNKAFGISREIEAIQRSYVPAGIEVEAAWSDNSQQVINVKTTTTFVEDMTNANYRISYLLLANGLTGTDETWWQSNYYAGSNTKDENLVGLTKEEYKMKEVTFNHVPVAAYKPFEGIEGSVPSTITQDVPMTHTYQIDITGNTRIQDKKKLSVVALLIDKKDGKIVNAAQYKFYDSDLDGISNTTFQTDPSNDNWYSIDGRRLMGQPVKNGIYIKNSRKVVVK